MTGGAAARRSGIALALALAPPFAAACLATTSAVAADAATISVAAADAATISVAAADAATISVAAADAATISVAAADAAATSLAVLDDEGRILLAVELPDDGRWCLLWNHSVTGIEVADCFRAGPGGMVLESSRQPDFAAGLGDLPGEGRVRGDGAGGYVIEGLARPVPAAGLALRRAGPAVDQRLRVGEATLPLPPGRRGERLLIRLEPGA